VAVVKSEITGQIYSRPGSSTDWPALVASTLKMFGPTALFTSCRADFILVRESPDPECSLWREFFAHDPDPLSSEKAYRKNRESRPPSGPEPRPCQRESARPVEEVAWGLYDAVFCYDIAVPRRVVQEHRGVFWSYWIGETGTPAYRQSYRQPLAGYHCFLNGGSRAWRVRPSLRTHVVEFPYILESRADHEVLGARPDSERQGVILEKFTSRNLPEPIRRRLESSLPVWNTEENPAARLARLHRARYFLQIRKETVWGNALHEAVQAGCVALANPESMPNNRSLVLPGLAPRTWEEAAVRIEQLEKRPAERSQLRDRQQARGEWLLCRRPLGDWFQLYQAFREAGRP